MHRKLRWTAAVAVGAAVAFASAALALAAPSVAGAQAGPRITVSAHPVALDAAPSGANSLVEPAITAAPDGSDAEWFVLSGRSQALLSISPTGRQSTIAAGLAADAGQPVSYASVAADGYDWILDNDQGPGNVLYAVGAAGSPSPGLNQVARLGDYGQDMTLGPDGSLYIADNDGVIRCRITPAPAASCAAAVIPPPFYDGAGAFAIDGGGNAVWFTDGAGTLGAYAATGFSGPYPASAVPDGSTDPGTIVTAPNGYVYMAGGAAPGSSLNTRILAFSPGDPEQVQAVASGLGDVVSMTIGPDGNVWFIDAGGNGSVGRLGTATGSVASYALPSGFWLPRSGWRIAAGPSVPSSAGTGEVFFGGTTAAGGQGNAAIGEVSGISFPVAPGALAFNNAARVSRRRRAVLKLTCSGQGNAGCAGRIRLSVRARVRVRSQVRAARGEPHARYHTSVQVRRLSLAEVAYAMRGGQSRLSTVRLRPAAYRLLVRVVGHHFDATVTSATTMGTVSGTKLTLTGPAPRRRLVPNRVRRPKRRRK